MLPGCSAPSAETSPSLRTPPSPLPRRSAHSTSGPGDVILTSRADYASNQIMYLSLARRLGRRDRPGARLARRRGGPRRGARSGRGAGARPGGAHLGAHQLRPGAGRRCGRRGLPRGRGAVPGGRLPGGGTDADGRRRPSAATIWPPPRGSSSADPAASASSTSSDGCSPPGPIPLLVDMHGATWTDPDAFELTPDARRFETWEISYALVLGLGAAARTPWRSGSRPPATGLASSPAYARARLARLPGVRVLDRGAELCAIVTAEPGGGRARRSSSHFAPGGSTPARPSGRTR